MLKPSTTLQSRAWVEVRLDLLRENALTAQRLLGRDRALLPMVKADAYGLGLEPVVRTLRETPGLTIAGFGIATVAEGEALRAIGWKGRVLVFTPAPPGELERAGRAGLTLCLSDVESVRRWAAVAEIVGRPLAVHTEVDTGMGRAGLPWERAAEWGPRVAESLGPLDWEGCFTHFHSADAGDSRPTDEQVRRFRSARDDLRRLPRGPRLAHAANSAAILRGAATELDLGRPGIFLYGGEAGGGTSPAPVVAVRARLALVRSVGAGATVGYGSEYSAAGDEVWGTLAIGYGDGVPRALWPGGGEVLVRGRRMPIVGRVSMDMTTVALSGVPEARPGEVATLIGRDGAEAITVDQVAARCGTISYEILTRLTERLPRVYLDGEDGRA